MVKENIPFTGPVANFTDRITELEAENSRLMGEVNKLKDTTTAELIFKRDAKEAANQLTAVRYIAELENKHLKRDIQKWATIAEDFRLHTGSHLRDGVQRQGAETRGRDKGQKMVPCRILIISGIDEEPHRAP
ncbi:uncharacterized protein K444DRAFT_625237 [Hyaloscypha bicolor E]|uniref:Uncharacterized protein n=1 Tax=Hyaloscypha bicolor E TaxID=1095630 RepID=A0A2J6TRN8_9HELO|nr:uncharacterized protein K444DRAFT_625237 [Hyaloscypha bicolor E]PMD65691.1 hypothetical protein K444DRAFT_625237 [Hyaloscypha bicolor E]